MRVLDGPWCPPGVRPVPGRVRVQAACRAMQVTPARARTRTAGSFPRDVGHEQPLDRPPAFEVGLADLVEVLGPHARVPDVVRLDRHGDAAAAVLEAARLLGHHALAEAALLEQRLEMVVERLRPLLAARSLRVAGRPRVGADEDLVLRFRHASIVWAAAVTMRQSLSACGLAFAPSSPAWSSAPRPRRPRTTSPSSPPSPRRAGARGR